MASKRNGVLSIGRKEQENLKDLLNFLKIAYKENTTAKTIIQRIENLLKQGEQ